VKNANVMLAGRLMMMLNLIVIAAVEWVNMIVGRSALIVKEKALDAPIAEAAMLKIKKMGMIK
jgi:hypothetical protein